MSGAALAGGIALAAVAGCCFDGAVALQALEARALEVRQPGAGMIRGLLARPRWLAATVLSLAGWPFQVAALALAPLTVVQPALAVGLILLLFLGNRLLHERVRPRDYAAVAAIGVGLALLAWKAPEAEHVHAGAKTLAIVLGILVGAAAIPWILRAPGAVMVIAAGLAFAASGLTSKLLADSFDDVTTLLFWGVVSAGIATLGLINEMAALQKVGAARVAAGAFALQTAIPVILAPALTEEHWNSPGDRARRPGARRRRIADARRGEGRQRPRRTLRTTSAAAGSVAYQSGRGRGAASATRSAFASSDSEDATEASPVAR